jgi:hypothetical protein
MAQTSVRGTAAIPSAIGGISAVPSASLSRPRSFLSVLSVCVSPGALVGAEAPSCSLVADHYSDLATDAAGDVEWLQSCSPSDRAIHELIGAALKVGGIAAALADNSLSQWEWVA